MLPVIALETIRSSDVQNERYFNPGTEKINEGFYSVEPYIRSLGISRHTKVISVPDWTPNLTLYYMNQPGWTQVMNPRPDIDLFIRRGAKYMIINDEHYLHERWFADHIDSLVGQYHGIYFYTVK